MKEIAVSVWYSCAVCGITRQKLELKAREGQDVEHWMQQVAVPAAARDHRDRQPFCISTQLSELYVQTVSNRSPRPIEVSS